MANSRAGEVTVTIDGTPHTAKLTLGALAELEETLKAGSLVELVERFETGAPRAADIYAVLVAGLRGGGWQGSARDLVAARIEDGPVEAARVAARLLAAAFGGAG